MPLLFVDVDYRPTECVVGWIVAEWKDDQPRSQGVARLPPAAPYEPGAFFKRELPPLLAAVQVAPAPFDAIVIDGYVWLGPEKPGLGAHLHEAVHGRHPVIGIAKRPYVGAMAIPVLRGTSKQPLFVTTVGVDARESSLRVSEMHGAHRIPTLLGRVDRLCRDAG